MKKANHFSFQILTLFIFITFSTNLTAQNNSKFVIGLSERLRFVSWDNAITLNDAADAANTFTRHRTSVWADWKPSDNLQFYVKLTNEFRYYFNPDDVVRTPVGSADFIFSSCDTGEMSWVIDRDGGDRRQGRMDLTRLSRVMGIPCNEFIGAPVLEIATRSGSWYDPTHSGEGYVLEILVDRRALVYWFSFDAEGQRRWFFGTGEIVDGNTLVFDDMLTTSGGVFGADFDPAGVEVGPWGTLQLQLACETGAAEFEPTEEGFSAGTLDLDRLTALAGLNCDG